MSSARSLIIIKVQNLHSCTSFFGGSLCLLKGVKSVCSEKSLPSSSALLRAVQSQLVIVLACPSEGLVNFLCVCACARVRRRNLVILRKSCRLLGQAVCMPSVPVKRNHFKTAKNLIIIVLTTVVTLV